MTRPPLEMADIVNAVGNRFFQTGGRPGRGHDSARWPGVFCDSSPKGNETLSAQEFLRRFRLHVLTRGLSASHPSASWLIVAALSCCLLLSACFPTQPQPGPAPLGIKRQ